MYLGFFSKSKSSAIDLDTQRSPLLLSRFKNCCAIGSPVSRFHSHDLQSVAGCSNLDWRKKEVLAEHPCAQWEVEILLGLNQCWGLKGTNISSFFTQEENAEEPAISCFPMLLVKPGNRRCFQASASSYSHFWNYIVLQWVIPKKKQIRKYKRTQRSIKPGVSIKWCLLSRKGDVSLRASRTEAVCAVMHGKLQGCCKQSTGWRAALHLEPSRAGG